MRNWSAILFAFALLGCEGETENQTAKTEDAALLYNWRFRGGLIPSVELNEREMIRKIREAILAKKAKNEAAAFKGYTGTIPETGVDFEMIAIDGGTFLMGSDENEPDRFEDEGPQHKVRVSPFWMGKFEVSWAEYQPYMITNVSRHPNGYRDTKQNLGRLVDWTSSPSTPYMEMSFGMGIGRRFPAICMTHHAASKYCQWLSMQTGDFYRLPTEAEWEYACRAGTTGAFSCPPDEIEDYAVIDPEQIRDGYVKMGSRKPNQWGLYDMHGNVMEWTMDGYDARAYEERSGATEPIDDPWVRPTQRYPRVARGGSWYDPAYECRSARRIFSDTSWQIQDPQLPKSIWYLT
ncbi:formylglycine-generating enzyme family protein, partial [Verrucomicrobiales bacterium]|nr:formylglycine-generating enzyme family protein [Verrucomicrobiales bacterium]